MQAAESNQQTALDNTPGTLGGVLYAKPPATLVDEREWVDLVRAVASGDQLALHAIYERAHRVVFTLAVRITGNRETAEELTVDVFHDVWRRASRYDEADGTVLGWIMNQARSRAIDRVRFERRKKRVDPQAADSHPGDDEADLRNLFEAKERSQQLHTALQALTVDERRAIEAAFFAELTYAQVAARLDQPLGTIKTRIRSGLQKMRAAMGAKANGQ